MATETEFTPPYTSFKTLDNLLNRLGAGPMPPRIDSGYLDNLSGGAKSSVMMALRTFNLIEADGTISSDLARMAQDEEFRRSKWAEILQEYYADQLALAQQNATAQQLEESFKGMGISGSTVRKAIVFYLAVVDYSGAPNSPHFRAPKQARRPRARKADLEAPRAGADEGTDARSDTEGDPGASLGTVKLPSGGTVRLSLTVDLFALDEAERSFVFSLIDQMRSFESSQASTTGEPEDDEY